MGRWRWDLARQSMLDQGRVAFPASCPKGVVISANRSFGTVLPDGRLRDLDKSRRANDVQSVF